MKIAIIGTGISGLATAYMLAPYHDITVFEGNDYLGGHSRTINVKVSDKKEFPVDTGFIVFNKRNYPNLTKLFDHLKVKYEKSDMSFGVSIDNGWLEYSSKSLFAQKQNFFRISFLKMLKDILYFNHKATKLIQSYPNDTVENFINRMSLGRWFNEYYLSAMGGCIWSTSISEVKRFPAKMLIQFFDNHGLLTVNNHPQWYTVSGGSKEYVKKISDSYQKTILVNTPISQVKRFNEHVCLIDSFGNSHQFDKVIMACHPDEALNLIKEPDNKESDILGCFTYQNNHIYVHRDKKFMPKIQSTWASWTYLANKKTNSNSPVSLTYWMNNLQNIDKKFPIFISLNPTISPEPQYTYHKHTFRHPLLNSKALEAQEKINMLQGHRNCWYVGAYQRYGFHEDGLLSAINVVRSMKIDIPWLN